MILDSTNIKDLNLAVKERPAIPTAEQDVDRKEIRGRNGSVTKKYAFKDREYAVAFNFLENTPFKPAFRRAKLVLFSAKKLSFEDDPGIYQIIKSVSIDDADNDIEEYGEFTVTFILDPFDYEETDPVVFTAGGNLDNPAWESDPIITVTMAGTGHLNIGDQELILNDVNGDLVIDCDQKNAYMITDGNIMNMNSHMVGDFPVIKRGGQMISFDGDISKVEIDPRRRWI